MMTRNPGRIATAMLLAGLALLLNSCMLIPGKFVSELAIRRDGTFTYSYAGDIVLLPLAMPDARPGFTPSPCAEPHTGKERPCSAAERAKQERDFAEQEARRAKSDAEAARLFLGGIDPAKPGAGEQIATRLRQQKGWRHVVYKGEGLFQVDFAIAGRLDHDFAFPTVERFAWSNAFVQVALRQDGSVRVDAPGFAPASGGNPALAMMMQQKPSGPAKATAPFPGPEGSFTVRTDAQVLANNTEQGASGGSGEQVLSWKIDALTQAAPMALLKRAP